MYLMEVPVRLMEEAIIVTARAIQNPFSAFIKGVEKLLQFLKDPVAASELFTQTLVLIALLLNLGLLDNHWICGG